MQQMSWIKRYLTAVLTAALISLLGEFLPALRVPTDLLMIYLLGVVITALGAGRGPAIVFGFLSVLSLEFLVFEPRYSFQIHAAEDLLTLFVLLTVGIIISTLAARSRQNAIEAEKREGQTRALYDLSRDLSLAFDLPGIVKILGNHLSLVRGEHGALFILENSKWNIHHDGQMRELFPNDWSAVQLTYETGTPSGFGTQNYGGSPFHFRRLQIGEHNLGVLGIVFAENEKAEQAPVHDTVVDSMAMQIAIAVERAKMILDAQRTALLREKEKLQSVLLNSISHDLRTPLFSIHGALNSLRKNKDRDEQTRRELIETAYFESERLNRAVGNLLDITRIEAGAFEMALLPCDIRDFIGACLNQFPKERLEDRAVKVQIPEDFPETVMDYTLMMRVMVNIIDNALKYSPAGTPVEISALRNNGWIQIEISNQGTPIPEKDAELIFDKFYRLDQHRKLGGIGLGLSICKGIVEAHKGRIWAEKLASGTKIAIALPINSRGDNDVKE